MCVKHPKMVGCCDGLWLGLLHCSTWVLTSFGIYDRGIQQIKWLSGLSKPESFTHCNAQRHANLRCSQTSQIRRPAARWSSSTPNIPQYPAGDDPCFNWAHNLVMCPLSIPLQQNICVEAELNCTGAGQTWDTNGPKIHQNTSSVQFLVNLKVLDHWPIDGFDHFFTSIEGSIILIPWYIPRWNTVLWVSINIHLYIVYQIYQTKGHTQL
jgi:hypothetical protein